MALSQLHEILVIDNLGRLRQLLHPFGDLLFNEIAEALVLQELFLEDTDGHTGIQRGAEEIEESLQLLLLMLGALSRQEISAHLFLLFVVEHNIMHSGVGHVDLLLEFGALPGAHLHK